MLAARGVSLGLGKINLSDLNHLPGERAQLARLGRISTVEKPKFIIRKKADAKTVWAACRAVIFGCVVISIGLAMAVLGYFDKTLSQRISVVGNESIIEHDKVIQYNLKSMQYVGPVLMGVGTFVLIIACVITLESRDKHAQIISEESAEARGRRLREEEERRESVKRKRNGRSGTESLKDEEGEEGEEGEQGKAETDKLQPHIREVRAEVHRVPRRDSQCVAPLADFDSLNDVSSSDPPSTSAAVV